MFKAHGLFAVAVVEGSRLYPYRKPNLTVISLVTARFMRHRE